MVLRKYVERQFASQFEEDEFGPVYRRNMMDPPVRVTAEERDAFIQSYGRKAVPVMWSFVVALLALMGATTVLAFNFESVPLELWLIPGMVLLIGGYVIGTRHHWNAPADYLRDRVPIGRARSRGEVRRRYLSKMSWLYIALICVPLLLVLVTNLVEAQAGTRQNHWLTIFITALGLILWGGVAVLKLRQRD